MLKPFLHEIELVKRYSSLLILVFLSAYGTWLFNFLLVGDSWRIFQKSDSFDLLILQAGRWLTWLVWQVSFDNSHVTSFSLFVLILSFVIGACLALNVLEIKNQSSKLIFIFLFGLNPVWVESVASNSNHLSTAIGLLLSISAAYYFKNYLRYRRKRHFILSTILLILSAGTWQPVLFFSPTLLLLYFIHLLIKNEDEILNRYWIYLLKLIVHLLLAIFSYFFITWIILNISQLDPFPAESRYSLMNNFVTNYHEIRQSIKSFFKNYVVFLFDKHHLFPVFVKVVFWSFLILSLVRFISYSRLVQQRAVTLYYRLLLIILTLIVVSIVPWSIGIVTILSSYRYTTLISTTLTYSFVLALTIEVFACEAWIRRTLIGISCMVIIVFMFQHGMAASRVYHTNIRTLSFANRILMQLENFYQNNQQVSEILIFSFGSPTIPESKSDQFFISKKIRQSSIDRSVVSPSMYLNIADIVRIAQLGSIKIKWLNVGKIQNVTKKKYLTKYFQGMGTPSFGYEFKNLGKKTWILKFS